MKVTLKKYDGHKIDMEQLSTDQSAVTEQTDKIIEMAKKDKKVIAVVLFGSHARKEAMAESDIDVCLILQNPENSSEKRIEYALSDKLDVQAFQALPMYIKMRILKEGKIMFCRNEKALYEIALKTIREFEDYKKFYYGYMEAMVNG